MPIRVSSLRRFPVKSMGGEVLNTALVDARGLAGDRWFAVEDAEGHFASGKNTRRFRRRDAVFEYSARTTSAGVLVRRDRQEWVVGDAQLDDELSRRIGVPVRVRPEGAVKHQDAGQVSLVGSASVDACASMPNVDADVRRLRSNLVIDTEEPWVEETWIGRILTVGAVRLRVVARIERCRMIDIPQNGVATRTPWLKALAAERDLRLGIYADVVQPGEVHLGDLVDVG